MVNVIAPIIAAVFFGVAFLAGLIAGLFKSGNSTQQLRWVLGLSVCLAAAVTYGAVSLHQPVAVWPDNASHPNKTVAWAIPTLHAFANPAVVAILTLGLFRSAGARMLPVMITFFSFGCEALGIYLFDFNLWYWFMLAAILFGFYILAILFVDRLDLLAVAVTKTKRATEVLDSSSWNGLLWRILSIVAFAGYHLVWALDHFSSNVITDYTVSFIIWAILDCIVYIGLVFLMWWFVAAVELDSSASMSNLAGSEAQKASQMGGKQQYSVLGSGRNNSAV